MKCEGCPYGGQCVDFSGPEDAEFVILGEAPGSFEVSAGKPFVGPSGALLWDTLERAGLPKETPLLVGNALGCKLPPRTIVDERAVSACRARVRAAVLGRPRRVVLALGNTALRSLLGPTAPKISAARGAAHTLEGTTIIPTLHPAAILRNPKDQRKFFADMKYAVEVYETGQIKGPGETEFRVVSNPRQARYVVDAIRSAGTVAADIETSGLHPRTDRVLCMGVCVGRNRTFIFPATYLRYLSDVLADRSVRWIWHNGKFDTAFLRAAGLPARVDDDTMLMHYALDEYGGGHGLKELSSELLGADGNYDAALAQFLKKTKANPTPSYADIPEEVLYEYLAKDCDYTYQLYEVLDKRIRSLSGLREMYERLLIPASNFLQRLEDRGLFLDRAAVAKLRSELELAKAAAHLDLYKAVQPYWDARAYARDTGAKKEPKEFNPGSWQQLGWVLFDQLKLAPTRKGVKMNTSAATLAALPEHPFIVALLAYRKATKMLSTYITGMENALEDDGRVHTTYLLHGTTTGRLSSSQPNLQNIPRNPAIRSIFGAPAGRILIECDFSAHELRCLAHLSGDPGLLSIIGEGRDFHNEVATALFGPAFDNEQRTLAKTVTFGIMFGRTGHGLSKIPGVTIEQGNKMVEDWFARFPRAKEFLYFCREAPLRGKTLVTPLGRRRRFPLITAENKNGVQNEAANFPVQSLASDLTLLSAMALEEPVKALGGRIVNTVHDSILIEAPDDQATVAKIVDLCMSTMSSTPEQYIKPRVRFEAEAKVGYSWGHMKKWQTHEDVVLVEPLITLEGDDDNDGGGSDEVGAG